ncbi:hypothetical protein GGR50DRAFT_98363 [Xylaria sp. CBS 124048]|nr:hypothetical protein GGR50DRAFT_98363 [Xylaria sp. CBS 124048]
MTALYDIVIPTLTNILKAEQDILAKGEAWAAEKGTPFSDLIEASLAPDMWNLSQQFTITAVHVTMFTAKITGATPNTVPMGPASLADVKKYLAETIQTLEAIKPADINGKENQILGAFLGAANPNAPMKAVDYVQGYLMPHVYFHTTTAYAILRSKGVPLEKGDFSGRMVKLA